MAVFLIVCQCPSDLQDSSLKSNNSGHTSEGFHITVRSVRVLNRCSSRKNACMTLLGFWAVGTDGAWNLFNNCLCLHSGYLISIFKCISVFFLSEARFLGSQVAEISLSSEWQCYRQWAVNLVTLRLELLTGIIQDIQRRFSHHRALCLGFEALPQVEKYPRLC